MFRMFNGKGKQCRGCGSLLLGESLPLCWRCRKNPPPWELTLVGHRYAGSWKLLVQSFKIERQWSLAPRLARSLLPFLEYPWPLVPVPGNPRGNRSRGFDPALKIAQYLGRLSRHEVIRIFTRTGGLSQKTLTREQRSQNLDKSMGIIALKKPLPKNLYLVDDVVTTGATARTCVKLLFQSGVERVIFLACAGV